MEIPSPEEEIRRKEKIRTRFKLTVPPMVLLLFYFYLGLCFF